MKKKLCNIDKERKIKGFTLAKLAEELGVSVPTIQGWKKNLFKPSARTVARMRGKGFSENACLDPAGIPSE